MMNLWNQQHVIKIYQMRWDYIKHESNGVIFFKKFPLVDYLDEIKKYLANIINKSKYTSSVWKMSFILGSYFHYEKVDKVSEKKNFYSRSL